MERAMHVSPLVWVGVLLLLSLLTSLGRATAMPVTPPTGLVSWWDGDTVAGMTAEDIHDGNDGTLMGGVSLAPGVVGNAFQFDGSNGHIVIAHETAFDFTTHVSVDAWVVISGGDGRYQSVVNSGE